MVENSLTRIKKVLQFFFFFFEKKIANKRKSLNQFVVLELHSLSI